MNGQRRPELVIVRGLVCYSNHLQPEPVCFSLHHYVNVQTGHTKSLFFTRCMRLTIFWISQISVITLSQHFLDTIFYFLPKTRDSKASCSTFEMECSLLVFFSKCSAATCGLCGNCNWCKRSSEGLNQKHLCI